jgi:hypothetical protein
MLEVEDLIVRDESRLTRDGGVVQEKVARFWLGKHGPFVERFPAAEWSDQAFRDRVLKLRQQLDAISR